MIISELEKGDWMTLTNVVFHTKIQNLYFQFCILFLSPRLDKGLEALKIGQKTK